MGIGWWSWLISTKPLWPHTDLFVVSFPEKRGKGTTTYEFSVWHIVQCQILRALIASTWCCKYKIRLVPQFSRSHTPHQHQTFLQLRNTDWACLICGPCLQVVLRLVTNQCTMESLVQKQGAQGDSEQWWQSDLHLCEGRGYTDITRPARGRGSFQVKKEEQTHSSACPGAEERQLRAGVEQVEPEGSVIKPSQVWQHGGFYPAPGSLAFTLQRHFPINKRAHQFSGVRPLHPRKVRPVGNKAHSTGCRGSLPPTPILLGLCS